ncbi:hypothetical protein DERP_012789 [Dermatophagoides pteronyssinus]|uniref:Uncharacterized protein n=1 Tax=Dermatophagoides pteronyssinus TaxID=6956 RepID=A0ABQ8JF41_DERPT|nr:hypothetical protein DERP_012789 [Dermatophagoides pteronyssinus]
MFLCNKIHDCFPCKQVLQNLLYCLYIPTLTLLLLLLNEKLRLFNDLFNIIIKDTPQTENYHKQTNETAMNEDMVSNSLGDNFSHLSCVEFSCKDIDVSFSIKSSSILVFIPPPPPQPPPIPVPLSDNVVDGSGI